VPGFALPLVVTDDVLVRYADQRCYPPNTPPSLLPGLSSSSSSSAAAAGDAGGLAAESAAAVWSQLELSLAGGEAPSTNWLDGAKQVRLKFVSILLWLWVLLCCVYQATWQAMRCRPDAGKCMVHCSRCVHQLPP
jgi:hypothetical protein